MKYRDEDSASEDEEDEETELDDVTKDTARELIEFLLAHPDIPKSKFTQIKCRIGKKHHYVNTMKDSTILLYVKPDEMEKIGWFLRRRLTRTLSGVTIVAIMTQPYECPGHCIYCPGQASQPGSKVAQSYTGREPAAMRSIMYHYDAYEQTFHRMQDQYLIGHDVDKIDLIIMGGTFLYTPQDYQEKFMKDAFDAIINFREPNFNHHHRTVNLQEAKQRLETAKTSLIGVNFETRPDYCTEPYVDRMLELGGTRVEIGVQTTREDVLQNLCRGHTIKDTQTAIRIAKDAGLKINAHMMPNLPGSTPESDIAMFRTLFENPDFRPDMLKIYPTLVIKGTKLYEMYDKGQYKPYPMDELIKVIATVKIELPPYVRVQRIQRDIPAYLVEAGGKRSNLRQLIQKELQSRQSRCNCIRCREEGFYGYQRNLRHQKISLENVQLNILEYPASHGTEFFISYEDKTQHVLFGFLRLRIPSLYAHRPEIKNQNATIVREIKVVGELVRPNATPNESQIQHRGYGKKLMAEAERISKERGCSKILVIAGIGVRSYFYKLGYHIDGPYVAKYL